ncbi:MAG: hypothetical protein ACOVO9_07985 [Bacteroidia bacterium]|jgi:hypothetical protein
MKKLTLLAAIIGMMLAGTEAKSILKTSVKLEIQKEFSKKKEGTWAGKMDGKAYWYKLDKNAKLWWSTDGKKWAEVSNQMWADKSGKWMKIGDNKLWWSADMGKTWSEVPEWKWEGPMGEWYQFDKDWSLWSNA